MHTIGQFLVSRRPHGRTADDARARAIVREGKLARGRTPRVRRAVGGEDGFLLIEVLISSVLVAAIVFATFSGFDVVKRVSADQRRHNTAALLASQSQEQLRTDPATALDALETAPHAYTTTVDGTTYSITQEAKPVTSAGTSTGCEANEPKAQAGANIQISSTVTWASLVAAGRPAVKQATIISPPTGSTLEVDVTGGGSPALPVSGVTAVAKFKPDGSEAFTTAEGTTAKKGCVVLTGLAATSATVEIPEKVNFVTPIGALKWPNHVVTIAPNITTHYSVRYAEGGRIQARFTYNGKSSLEGKAVESDTFAVFNTNIPEEPQYEVGSTGFEYQAIGEEKYRPLTSKYGIAAITAAGAKYASGDLFPFLAWSVNAGDCHANGTVSKEAIAAVGPNVESGKTAIVEVPLSYTLLNVYSGTQATPGSLESTSYPVKINDTECASSKPANNAFAVNLVHLQNTTSAGHLELPFQPFGKAALCVYNKLTKRTHTVSYTNTTTAGSTTSVYMGEASEAEKKAAREAAEAATKSNRETREASERAKWLQEEKEKLITFEQRQAKEAAQTTARETAISNEKTAKANAEAAEAAEAKTKQVAVAGEQLSC